MVLGVGSITGLDNCIAYTMPVLDRVCIRVAGRGEII